MPQAASTRWCPTPEQLMILEQLYRGGIRTPNASQIQQITAHLSLYGKIEGKNVFYWFQNHKARDRQKIRRRLSREQKIFEQQNQQHSCLMHSESGTSSICLTNQNSHQFSHQGGGGSGGMEETAQVMNLLCKLERSDRNEMEMKQQLSSQLGYESNCMMMMMEMMRGVEEDLPSPVYNRPLKTLELFPTSSTGDLLKEETSSSSTNF